MLSFWRGVRRLTRWGPLGVARLDRDARPSTVVVDQTPQSGAGRTAARTDVAGGDLGLLDVHVRVEGDPEQVVGRVAADDGLAADTPVVGQAHLVDLPALHGEGDDAGASIAVRALTIVAHPPWSRPRSRASSGETSQKNSGCSSDRYGSHRLIPPAVWCSVRRYVVKT